MWNGATIKGFM